MADEYYYYGGGLQDYQDESREEDSVFAPVSQKGFEVLDDIDTVLFFRVNSFIHSISNKQLKYTDENESKMNESFNKLDQDEKTEFAQGKINFFFHQLKDILSTD